MAPDTRNEMKERESDKILERLIRACVHRMDA